MEELAITFTDDTTGAVKLSRKAAALSGVFKEMLEEDHDEDEELPISMTRAAFEPIREFMERHKDDPLKTFEKPIKTTRMEDLVGKWDADFINRYGESPELFPLLLDSNYLDVPSLKELCLAKLATIVKTTDPDGLKKWLKVQGEISKEEEAEVRKKNPWIFDV